MVTINTGQIVYLECLDQRLYAEAIQVAGGIRLWCRPLMLVCQLPYEAQYHQQMIAAAATDPQTCDLDLYDLKTAPDLVWPLDSFQMAFDTDFFALLFHLRVADDTGPDDVAKQRFQNFLRTCWSYDSRASSGDDYSQSSTKLTSIR